MNQEDIPILAKQCAPLVNTSVDELRRMARLDIIPVQRTGVRGRGLRFVLRDVKAALAARPAWRKAS